MSLVAIGFLPLSPSETSEIADRNASRAVDGDDPRTGGPEKEIVLAAARAWRGARLAGAPVQPALYRTLKPHLCGVLAPVLDSLFAVYERAIGKPIRAGTSGCAVLTADEENLLGLFGEAPGLPAASGGDRLSDVLRIAAHSSRIMIRLALDG
jgi:hypothetical protein